MNTQMNNQYFIQQEDNVDLKHEVKRFLRYWPWFVLTMIVSLIAAYSYLRYTPRIYETSAKIKILDESEGLELPTSAFVFKRVNINLENEIEILNSYLINERVVRKLNLTVKFFEEGTLQTSQLAQLPIFFEQIVDNDSIIKSKSFKIEFTKDAFKITDIKTEKPQTFANHTTYLSEHNLPFEIKLEDKTELNYFLDKNYIVKFSPIKNATLGLKSSIIVEAIGEQSDLLKLSIKGESTERSELILNTLVGVFNKDGINDRQLVSKRTLDFIDERFIFLASELDSIEIDKKDYKKSNNLVDLATDAEISLQQRSQSDDEVFRIENQLSLAELLESTIKENNLELDLLPANIGLDNQSINGLVNEYNTVFLEREKLIISGGINNPTVKLLTSKVRGLQSNLDRSILSYNKQLKESRRQLVRRNQKFSGQVSRIPEKEKLMRAINRQQTIKESLYLLLLQKREEAAINLAITEPSIKIVENALSGTSPVSPKSNIIYAGAILAGLLLPFGILYLIFMLDTKVHTKEDISKGGSSKIPIIGEIPTLKNKEKAIFTSPNDRSVLAESFRILSSNVNYILPVTENSDAKVIYCTSTIKGEGKTYISINLSLALSSLNKRVLLIGADLRNPQIHNHINLDKQHAGLTNYLHDSKVSWKSIILKGFEKHSNHDTILSGPIPPNPAHLLTNGRFKQLIEEAKLEYDYIIVDTAPTILVTDTMLISQLADATIYIARANFTEKNLLNFSKDLNETGKLKNMAYVVNSVGASKSYGYSYNYGYGYGYGGKA